MRGGKDEKNNVLSFLSVNVSGKNVLLLLRTLNDVTQKIENLTFKK